MKSVSDNYLAEWSALHRVGARRISYKRRFFNTDTNAFQLEANSRVLGEDSIESIGQITWKLDTETLNQFSSANVVITVRNNNNEWDERNELGIWKVDDTAKVGYIPYLSEFKIDIGYRLPSGIFEYATIFTGYIGDDMIADTDSATMQIPLISSVVFLQQGDAENVGTNIALSNLVGTVNGLNKVFTTNEQSIGTIQVYVNGILQRAGTDYVLDFLNDPILPAQVTFILAPTTTPQYTALQWFENRKVDELVGFLCDEAGISNRTIDPVLFPNGVINRKLIDSQLEFDNGIYSQTESKPQFGGLVQVDFIPTYVDVNNAPSVAGFDSNNGKALAQSFISTKDQFLTVADIKGKANTALTFNHTGSIRSDLDGLPGEVLATFFFQTSNTANSLKSLVFSSSVKAKRGQRFWLYLDPQTTASASFDWDFGGNDYVDGSAWNSIDGFKPYDFYFDVKARQYFTTGTTRWRSEVIDGTTSLKAWGQVRVGVATPSGTSVRFTTETSSDGFTFDPEVELPANGQVQSVIKRYLRFNVYFTATITETPLLDEVIIQYITADTVIALANFTGMTCQTAILELAKLCASEFGFDADGAFFFRNRTVNDVPLFELDQHNALVRVVNSVSGIKNLRNNIHVSYGGYTAKVTPQTQGDRTPNSFDRYGYSFLSVSSQIIISSDADIATGTALFYYQIFGQVKRYARISSRLVPQIDLGDVGRFSFLDNRPNPVWFWGDSTRTWAQSGLRYIGERQQFFFSLVAKVVGITYNLDNFTCELEVTEVL